MAQRLARYPLPPRLSRILVEAMERGVGEDGCVAAALLGSGVQVEKNDLLAAMEIGSGPPHRCSTSSNSAELRVLPGRRITTTTLC